MANGGIIGPTNDPVINDLITTTTSSTPGFAVNSASSTVSALIVAGGGNANSEGVLHIHDGSSWSEETE